MLCVWERYKNHLRTRYHESWALTSPFLMWYLADSMHPLTILLGMTLLVYMNASTRSAVKSSIDVNLRLIRPHYVAPDNNKLSVRVVFNIIFQVSGGDHCFQISPPTLIRKWQKHTPRSRNGKEFEVRPQDIAAFLDLEQSSRRAFSHYKCV